MQTVHLTQDDLIQTFLRLCKSGLKSRAVYTTSACRVMNREAPAALPLPFTDRLSVLTQDWPHGMQLRSDFILMQKAEYGYLHYGTMWHSCRFV